MRDELNSPSLSADSPGASNLLSTKERQEKKQEELRKQKRVWVDESGRLIPYRKPKLIDLSRYWPRFSVGELVAICTMTPINMALARSLDPQRPQASVIIAALLTIGWFVAMNRQLPGVKLLIESRSGFLAWWFVRWLPTIVLLAIFVFSQLTIPGQPLRDVNLRQFRW